jgi:hypothetical protein
MPSNQPLENMYLPCNINERRPPYITAVHMRSLTTLLHIYLTQQYEEHILNKNKTRNS